MRGCPPLLLAALLFATAARAQPDGGVDWYDVDRAQLHLVDGRELGVAGGAWLSDRQVVATGRELARLRAENDALLDNLPAVRWLLVAVLAGFAAGAVTVAVVWWQLR